MKKQSRLDVRKFSFSQRTINVWNKLSAECVHASSVNMFKMKLYFRHIYNIMAHNNIMYIRVQHVHRGMLPVKYIVGPTVHQCFLNLELKSDVLATVFTTLVSELSTRSIKP